MAYFYEFLKLRRLIRSIEALIHHSDNLNAAMDTEDLSANDIEALREDANALIRLIAFVREHADEGTTIIQKYAEQLSDAIGEVEELLPPEIRDALTELIKKHDSLPDMAQEGRRTVDELGPQATEYAIDNRQQLDHGDKPQKHLDTRFLCAVAGISIVAGIVTVWIPPHVHAGAAVTLGIATRRGLRCD